MKENTVGLLVLSGAMLVLALVVGYCYQQERTCAKAGGTYLGATCFESSSLHILPLR